jgi:hypothetical protein
MKALSYIKSISVTWKLKLGLATKQVSSWTFKCNHIQYKHQVRNLSWQPDAIKSLGKLENYLKIQRKTLQCQWHRIRSKNVHISRDANPNLVGLLCKYPQWKCYVKMYPKITHCMSNSIWTRKRLRVVPENNKM